MASANSCLTPPPPPSTCHSILPISQTDSSLLATGASSAYPKFTSVLTLVMAQKQTLVLSSPTLQFSLSQSMLSINATSRNYKTLARQAWESLTLIPTAPHLHTLHQQVITSLGMHCTYWIVCFLPIRTGCQAQKTGQFQCVLLFPLL